MASYQRTVSSVDKSNYNSRFSISASIMSTATVPPNPRVSRLMSSLKSIIPEDEIITKDSSLYKENSQPWAAQKDQKPPLVVRPGSATALSKIVSLFYSMDIDFTVRGHGFMSSSAHEVIISMAGFDDFQLDREKGLATVGAGQTWIDVYQKIEDAAPDHTSEIDFSQGSMDILTHGSCRCSNSLCWRWRHSYEWWLFVAFGGVWLHI